MNSEILVKYPELENLRDKKPYLWINPEKKSCKEVFHSLSVTKEAMIDAKERLDKFAPLLARLFPELAESHGIIESDILTVENFKKSFYPDLKGDVLIKADHALPVAGSVKARGGIYEVLLFAEKTAKKHGLLKEGESYLTLLSDEVKKCFKNYTVSVGSTGNLGLSIGVTASALGFNSKVHMSIEAKEWKKKRLRDKGVSVIEHKSDYSNAVYEGRKAALNNPNEYFVDDENSLPLFLGYSVAALRLMEQLTSKNICVDGNNPLFVYLPCGVGGAPCGIAFGLKQVFGDHVHCFFAEPMESPCMMLGLITNFEDDLSVYDIGLTNNTCADGLAVSTPSVLAGNLIKNLISGSFTALDETLYNDLTKLYKLENIAIEPSAAAGFRGPLLLDTEHGKKYIKDNSINFDKATHILWTTGGSFVPEVEFRQFLKA
jgi:D-serine dehydratase